jgi:hypothetical protein
MRRLLVLFWVTVGLLSLPANGQVQDYPFRIEDYRNAGFSQQKLEIYPTADFSGSSSVINADSRVLGNNRDLAGGASHQAAVHRSNWEYYGIHTIYGHWQGSEQTSTNDSMPLFPRESNYSSRSDLWFNVSFSESAKRYFRGILFGGIDASLEVLRQPAGNDKSEVTGASIIGANPDSVLVWKTENENRSSYNYVTFSMKPTLGSGGISNVTYAAVALNMLDRIAAVSGKKPDLSASQINEFARYLEKRKRTWAFDYREGRIDNLDSIMGWLIREKAVDRENTRMTMEIFDQWDYGYQQERLAGIEWKLYPLFQYGHYSTTRKQEERTWDTSMVWIKGRTIKAPDPVHTEYSETSTSTNTNFSYGAGTFLNFAKPWRRFWQINAQMGAAWKMRQNNYLSSALYRGNVSEQQSEQVSSYPELSLEGAARLSWFPTTRTTCMAGLFFMYTRTYNYQKNSSHFLSSVQDLSEELDRTNDIREAIGQVFASITYYLSSSLSYQVNGTVGYSDLYANQMSPYNQKNTKVWRYSLNTGLTWRVF